MSDQTDPRKTLPRARAEMNDIPVEELIRRTREFTRRITNEDRQRLGLDIRESGHSRSLQHNAPILLQQFFAGEIDLDLDLAGRYPNAPLLSHVRFSPGPGEPLGRQATAVFAVQDDSASLVVDAQLHGSQDLTFTYIMFGALGMRFTLSPLVEADRKRWLEQSQRRSGISFLWTHERWDHPYLIFVVREGFARVYAFAPSGLEAAVRMTPDMLVALRDWLAEIWFPGDHTTEPAPPAESWDRRPTQLQRPEPAAPVEFPDAPPVDDWVVDVDPGGESDLPEDDLNW